MDNTTYIALSRINALTHDLEVTSNNLANANTTGFKASRELFSDYIVKQKTSTAFRCPHRSLYAGPRHLPEPWAGPAPPDRQPDRLCH